jgi:hypothetical protein
VVPDLTYLPEKYHKFVTSNVRRIYVDFSSANKELRESLKAAEGRLARKAATEQALLTRCEELTEALIAHRQGERDANQRILELEDDIANMEKVVQENDDKAKEFQRMHGLVLDKVKCVEKSNQVLQKENVRLSLNYHDIGMKLKEKEPDSNTDTRADTSSNQTTYLYSSQSASAPLRPKQKQRKYVVRIPQGDPAGSSNARCTIQVSTSEDAPVAISMSTASASTSRSIGSSRPIKPLPKRRGIKNRVFGDSSFMSIDVSDFV